MKAWGWSLSLPFALLAACAPHVHAQKAPKAPSISHGLFSDVHDEVGDVIVADVSTEGVRALLAPDRDRLNALIQRKYPYEPVEVAVQIMQRTGRGERT